MVLKKWPVPAWRRRKRFLRGVVDEMATRASRANIWAPRIGPVEMAELRSLASSRIQIAHLFAEYAARNKQKCINKSAALAIERNMNKYGQQLKYRLE